MYDYVGCIREGHAEDPTVNRYSGVEKCTAIFLRLSVTVDPMDSLCTDHRGEDVTYLELAGRS